MGRSSSSAVVMANPNRIVPIKEHSIREVEEIQAIEEEESEVEYKEDDHTLVSPNVR